MAAFQQSNVPPSIAFGHARGSTQRSTSTFKSRKLRNVMIVVMLFVGYFMFFSTYPTTKLESEIQEKATHLKHAATNILPRHHHQNYNTPHRLMSLLHENKIVGDKLVNIQAGTMTIEEALYGKQHQHNINTKSDVDVQLSDSNSNNSNKKPPMSMDEVLSFLSNFVHELHLVCVAKKQAKYFEIWQAYHDLAVKTLYPWDREYLQRMPERREDDSIYLSLASYRDENCLNTISQAYAKAKHPHNLFVGLVQQNCEEHCRSGVLVGGKMEDVEPDQDCHKAFCESPEGKPYCDAGQVRALHIQESESLGPYAARYFGSKLWGGEQWYMQIDSHMTFAQDWDASSVEMLQNAPTKKPVISHYPPSEDTNFEWVAKTAAPRLCHAIFADSEIESQIIRLLGNGVSKSIERSSFDFSCT